jgi:hypothetical protein
MQGVHRNDNSCRCFSRLGKPGHAQHAGCMLRVHDAKNFRGDVSDKTQVRSNSSRYSLAALVLETPRIGFTGAMVECQSWL